MEPRERLEKLRRLKALRQKASGDAPSSAPVQSAMPAPRPVGPTPVAAELRTQPERTRYTQEMTAQAFGDRPSSGEYLVSGLFGTEPIRPSMFAGEVDLTQQEPGLSPAFTPDIVGAIGGAAAYRAGQGVTRGLVKRQAAAKRDWMDDILEPYMGRAAQIQRELRGADKDLLGNYKFRLSKQMRDQKEILKTIPGVTNRKNLRDNLGVVSRGIGDAADKLNTVLKRSGKAVSKQEIESKIRAKIASYQKSLRGVTAPIDDDLVDRSIHATLTAYDDVPSNPAGLWQARRLVDNEFKDLNGPRRYAAAVSGDPSTLIPTKQEVIWDLTREAMLELMEDKVPGAKKQMRKISIMYDIQHTLATKAPDVKARAAARIKDRIPLMGDKPISLKPRNWINR